MSQPGFVPPIVDFTTDFSATESAPRRTVDWTGYPMLFDRVPHRATAPPESGHRTTIETNPQPERIARSGRDIGEAFLGYCQAILQTGDLPGVTNRLSERSAARHASAAALSFGFSEEEIRQLGFGLYSGPAAIREHLRGVGFSDAEIDASQLVSDRAARPRSELAGNLLIPLVDERGETQDYLLVSVDHRQSNLAGYRYLLGTATTHITAHGLHTTLARTSTIHTLVLVEDILDSLLLQCRGMHTIVASGGRGGEFAPRRWEELARLGVENVVLAFRRDTRHVTSVRDALVNALRARTAPAVYVVDDYPSHEESLREFFQDFGRDASERALARRTLAFHGKDFGAGESIAEIPLADETPDQFSVEPYYRTAFRQHLTDLVAALPEEYRPRHSERLQAADEAIRTENWRQLHEIVGQSAQLATRPEPIRPIEPPVETNRSTPRPLVSNITMVLNRMDDRSRLAKHSSVVNSHRVNSAEATPSPIEWLAYETADERLHHLCERILDACEKEESERLVIACREHGDQEFLVALTRQLARRLSQGHMPTREEVQRRLSAANTRVNDTSQPWWIDEAVERLQLWSNRLYFINCAGTPDCWTTMEHVVGEFSAHPRVGGLFWDGDASGETCPHAMDGHVGLRAFARRFQCPVVVATAWRAATAAPTKRHDLPASEAEIDTVFAEWEERELEARNGESA